jgi:hypothetical protein
MQFSSLTEDSNEQTGETEQIHQMWTCFPPSKYALNG